MIRTPGSTRGRQANDALLGVPAASAAENVGGDRLVHVDLRADNVLIDGGGRAVIADWPWAAHGASWFDALTLLVDARVSDPDCDTEAALGEHTVFAAATPHQVDIGNWQRWPDISLTAPATFTAGASYFARFPEAEGAACLGWLRERLEGSEPARVF